MAKSLNESVAIYKKLLEQGDIQVAYEGLLKYLMSLKSYLSSKLSDKFNFGSLCRGYLDYTYFPFFDEFLRSEKLRFGIVLNHREMRFELWLMGQNSDIQAKYWETLKNTKWNKDRETMPQYSTLEVILVKSPNFNDLETLTADITTSTIDSATEIIEYIKNKDKSSK